MGYVKLKKAKAQEMPVIADNDFDMSFYESLIITAAMDGLIDNTGISRPAKAKRIHKLK